MAYNVEFNEPYYNPQFDQWVLEGFLHLRIEGQNYRTLTVKHWLSHEARWNQNWFANAKDHIRLQLEQRADRETRAALQYRPPQPASFERISIPFARRIYPSLMANEIIGIQPLIDGPSTLTFWERFRYSENSGTGRPSNHRRYIISKPNWKEEGF